MLLAGVAAAPEEDIDPSDLEIGQTGKLDTRGGKLSYFSPAENPIGEDEVGDAPAAGEAHGLGPGDVESVRDIPAGELGERGEGHGVGAGGDGV